MKLHFGKLATNEVNGLEFILDCTESLPSSIGDAGGRASTVVALGDAGAVAESLSMDCL